MIAEDEINEAIARVILSTKRKNRPYSIYDIALDIQALKEAEGSLKSVSDTIGISMGMLNQFLSVFKLPKEVVNLIKERKIDSVSIVYNLSKFRREDLIPLSKLIVSNQLSSQDLKVLAPYRKQYPDDPIEGLVERLHSTKNIKVSVIRISETDTEMNMDQLSDLFADYVGKKNLVDVVSNYKQIDIKLSKEGECILREVAKSKKQSFHEFISTIVG